MGTRRRAPRSLGAWRQGVWVASNRWVLQRPPRARVRGDIERLVHHGVELGEPRRRSCNAPASVPPTRCLPPASMSWWRAPNVGGRMREHRDFTMQFRLVDDLGDNELLGSEAGQVAAMEEYETSQSGPLAVPMFDIVGICKTRPEHERPNAQLQIAPFSMRPFEPGKAVQLEKEPGISCLGFVLRPDSKGSIRITAADPDAPTTTARRPSTSSARSAACSQADRWQRRSTTRPCRAPPSRPTTRSSTPGCSGRVWLPRHRNVCDGPAR